MNKEIDQQNEITTSPTKGDFRNRRTFFFVIFLLAIAIAFVATEIVRYSRNSPNQHHNWINSKLLLANIPMGALESMQSRNMVARNRLNLHAWHGHNEILLTKVFKLGEMQFRTRIEEDSYLVIIFDKTAEHYSALRLSRNPRYPSALINADSTGQFSSKTAISDIQITDGWHTIKLKKKDGTLHLQIGDHVVGKWKSRIVDQQIVGFRSGAGAGTTIVDDVILYDPNGREILSESFRNAFRSIALFFFVLFAIAVLIGFLFAAAYHWKRSIRITGFVIIMIQGVTLILLTIFLIFDFFHWSHQYHFDTFVPLEVHSDWNEKSTKTEAWRSGFFDNFETFDQFNSKYESKDVTLLVRFLLLEKGPPYQHGALQIKRSSVPDKSHFFEVPDDEQTLLKGRSTFPASSLRTMFIGTSQTWGEGAATRGGQFSFRLHDRMRKKVAADVELITINAAIRGSDASFLIQRYLDRLHLLEPHLVIVNLSNNDSYKDPEKFKASLKSLVEFNQTRKIKTLFSLEANSPETDTRQITALREFHQIMQSVADTYGVICVDLNTHLASELVYDSGFIWWDYVHLTSHGQATAADFLMDSIVREISLPAIQTLGSDDIGARKIMNADQ